MWKSVLERNKRTMWCFVKEKNNSQSRSQETLWAQLRDSYIQLHPVFLLGEHTGSWYTTYNIQQEHHQLHLLTLFLSLDWVSVLLSLVLRRRLLLLSLFFLFPNKNRLACCWLLAVRLYTIRNSLSLPKTWGPFYSHHNLELETTLTWYSQVSHHLHCSVSHLTSGHWLLTDSSLSTGSSSSSSASSWGPNRLTSRW